MWISIILDWACFQQWFLFSHFNFSINNFSSFPQPRSFNNGNLKKKIKNEKYQKCYLRNRVLSLFHRLEQSYTISTDISIHRANIKCSAFFSTQFLAFVLKMTTFLVWEQVPICIWTNNDTCFHTDNCRYFTYSSAF